MAPARRYKTFPSHGPTVKSSSKPASKRSLFVPGMVISAILAALYAWHAAPPQVDAGSIAFSCSGSDGAAWVPTWLAALKGRDDAVERLRQWLESGNVDASAVRVTDISGMRGLVAARAAQAGETLLSLPTPFCLSITTCTFRKQLEHELHHLQGLTRGFHDSGEGSGGRYEEDDRDEESMLLDVVALLGEVLVAGEASPWSNFIETLPSSFNTPVNYSSPACSMLLGAIPALSNAVQRRQHMLRRALPRLRTMLQGLPGSSYVRSMTECQLWDAVVWASAAVSSRVLAMDPGDATKASGMKLPPWVINVGALMPLMDMANHPSPGEVPNCRADGGSNTLSLIATRPVAPGDPLVFEYRPASEAMCNWHWLLEYGFAIEEQNGSGTTGESPRRPASTQSDGRERQQRRRRPGTRGVDCYSFHLSLKELVHSNSDIAAAKGSSSSSGSSITPDVLRTAQAELDAEVQAMGERLVAAGLGPSTDISLRGGRVESGVLRWIGIALGSFRDVVEEDDEDAQVQRLMAVQQSGGLLSGVLKRRQPALAALTASGASAPGSEQCPWLLPVVRGALASLEIAVDRLEAAAAGEAGFELVFAHLAPEHEGAPAQQQQ